LSEIWDRFKKLHELEWSLIYSLIVAGKSATFADRATQEFVMRLRGDVPPGHMRTPFQIIRIMNDPAKLEGLLKLAKTGNYGKLTRALTEIAGAHINLETCGPEELERIHGIGPKTSRFFILWTRPGAEYAALDTHILAWLRETVGVDDAPKSTPPAGKLYERLEAIFIKQAKQRNLTPRELDWQIWKQRSGHEG
jgi:hypothetical protein